MDGQPALIRVRMPDRPGALGLVTSRIGALKADIVAIEILGRVDGHAYDEIAVVLPDAALVKALTREIEEVDGVRVEAVELIQRPPEPRLDMLRLAFGLASATTRAELTSRVLAALAPLDASWAGIIDGDGVASVGPCPPTLAAAASAASATVPVGTAILAVRRDRPLERGRTGPAHRPG